MTLLKFLVICSATLGVAFGVTLAPLKGTEAENIIPGEYIAVLKDGATELTAETRNAVYVIQAFEINYWHAFHVHADEASLDTLRADPNVDFVEMNSESGHADCTEELPGSAIWGLVRTSHAAVTDYENQPYRYDSDGANVDAYILDSGIYIEHNDFGSRARHGFVASNINEGNGDLNSHGTHVGGTVAGTKYGVAQMANLIAVKVLNAGGSGSVSGITEGVQFVTSDHQGKQNKRSVANMSLGTSPPSSTLEAAINASIAAGVNYCVSARNNNRDSCVDSPSRLPAAITCAASDINDNMASFTNYGPCVNIIAPGVSVLSANIGDPDASTTKSGTSMSAPHVAGAVARYLSTFDDNNIPTPAEVLAYIQTTSTKDAINLVPPKDTTPNYLLHASCAEE